MSTKQLRYEFSRVCDYFNFVGAADGVGFTVYRLCGCGGVLAKINVHILYLGSDQRVQPLDRFIVRYEAVHPIHVQHDLTESWRERAEEEMAFG